MVPNPPRASTPADILARLSEQFPDMYRLHFEPHLAEILEEPAKRLGDLQRRHPGQDPDELLRDRFLCRGGTILFPGITGSGKSSLTMQMSVSWANGLPCFDIRPAFPLRVFITQAENDEGDMAEMRDGVIAGMCLTQEQVANAHDRVLVKTDDTNTREKFTEALARSIEAHHPDLIIIDPALAYIGGDVSAQREVTPFLRNMLNPIIHKYRVGCLLVHHVNKPPSGEVRRTWEAGELAYLGAGSAEFANWARGVLALRGIGSHTIFELVAAKRGRRLGWKDELGQPTMVKYVAHAKDPGQIHWRAPAQDELDAEIGSRASSKAIKALNTFRFLSDKGESVSQAELIFALQRKPTKDDPGAPGLSEKTAERAVDDAKTAKLLAFTGAKKGDKGRKSPTLAETDKAKTAYPVEP